MTATSNDVDAAKKALTPVDLRSDTVTKPTPAMRRAMAEAEVGDDVYGEDPTVNRLQARAAEIFEREAALFVPTGSMGNLVAIKTWTQPGQEVICETGAHINQYEFSSMSFVAGCMPRAIPAPDGLLTWELIEPMLQIKHPHKADTGLIELENTHNVAGGTVYPTHVVEDICDHAHALGLRVHLDGARIFNAANYLKKGVAEITSKVDSIMFCLSKGLGAPVGSMLVGSLEFIQKAHRYRKSFGGGMRQVGVLAAAGMIALEESPKGLANDHKNARLLADELSRMPGIRLDASKVMTNIVRFDVSGTGRTAAEICGELKKRGILAGPFAKYAIRMVTHYDVGRAGIERALEAMREITRK
ncbi:MAG: beta-eliminating lyase-related protein [Acidobacteria bacterium]|nr:beta-eliminating lyase-related protein [Acidobacteriota bacterium]MCL5287833.1 beta-eliminating lyase-related protein [Acidobacteriota bacterium]